MKFGANIYWGHNLSLYCREEPG